MKAKGLYGDPSKVASEVVEKEYEATKKVVDEALEHGLKLIAEAFEKAYHEAESRLRSEIGRAEEQLRSVVSSLELELKSEVSDLKSRYLQEALQKALERVGEIKQERVYEEYLVRVLSRLSSEEYEELVVKAAQDDLDRIQALISRLGLRNLRVSREPAPILGGVVAETPDGSVRLDYSLDLLVKMYEHRLLGAASRVLFPEL